MATYSAELNTKRAELDRILREIGSLDANIINCEREIQTLNEQAEELVKRASDLDEEADTKTQRIFWGGLASFGMGLAFASFTGGASLVAAVVVAGLNAGYNLGSASGSRNAANEKRGTENAKCIEVQNWRSQRNALVAKKDELEKQIRQLEQK